MFVIFHFSRTPSTYYRLQQYMYNLYNYYSDLTAYQKVSLIPFSSHHSFQIWQESKESILNVMIFVRRKNQFSSLNHAIHACCLYDFKLPVTSTGQVIKKPVRITKSCRVETQTTARSQWHHDQLKIVQTASVAEPIHSNWYWFLQNVTNLSPLV